MCIVCSCTNDDMHKFSFSEHEYTNVLDRQQSAHRPNDCLEVYKGSRTPVHWRLLLLFFNAVTSCISSIFIHHGGTLVRHRCCGYFEWLTSARKYATTPAPTAIIECFSIPTRNVNYSRPGFYSLFYCMSWCTSLNPAELLLPASNSRTL